MRVAITGATGNVGTSLLRVLGADDAVDEIVGIARRKPEMRFDKTTFVAAAAASKTRREPSTLTA